MHPPAPRASTTPTGPASSCPRRERERSNEYFRPRARRTRGAPAHGEPSPQRTRSCVLVCVAACVRSGYLDGHVAGARGRSHDERAWSPRTGPACGDARAARTAHRDFRSPRRVGPRLRVATTSTFIGFATAAVFAAWHPVHAWLFGGYVHYAGTEPSLAAYVLRDGMLALAVALPVAAVV